MRRTSRPPRPPVEDLREKLNRKRQEKLEQNPARDAAGDSKKTSQGPPPPDPPSLLRDPLRGDEIPKTAQADKNVQHGRGRRGRGVRGQIFYGRRPSGLRVKPLNIVVEFSNPGERRCTIDENTEVHNLINTPRRGRGSYRGRRNFRGFQRNRGGYGGRNRGDLHHVTTTSSKLQETEEKWDNLKMPLSIETEEDWTTDERQEDVNDNVEDQEDAGDNSTDQGDVNDNSSDWNDQYEEAEESLKDAENTVCSWLDDCREEEVETIKDNKIKSSVVEQT